MNEQQSSSSFTKLKFNPFSCTILLLEKKKDAVDASERLFSESDDELSVKTEILI